MKKMLSDNYEKQVYIARDLFLKYDQRNILKKLPLKYDEEYLYLSMLDMELRVSRMTGQVEMPVTAGECVGKQRCAAETAEEEDLPLHEICTDYATVMTVYDVLCYSEKSPVLSGMWCPLNSLQVTLSNPDADLFTRKYARAFSGKIHELKEACRRIGGMEPAVSAHSDVCWQFDIFPFFPVQFRFWDGDEEFEPKIQLLWDKNSLKFMHFETLYYAMGILMQRLMQETKCYTRYERDSFVSGK